MLRRVLHALEDLRDENAGRVHKDNTDRRVLIILPIYISILLLAKAISGILALVKPITASIPAGVEFREVLAILALVVICFIAGLLARTGPGFRAKNAFEEAVLSKLPGYTLCVA